MQVYNQSAEYIKHAVPVVTHAIIDASQFMIDLMVPMPLAKWLKQHQWTPRGISNSIMRMAEKIAKEAKKIVQ